MGGYVFTEGPLNPIPPSQRGRQMPSVAPPAPRTRPSQPKPTLPLPFGIGGTIPVRRIDPLRIENVGVMTSNMLDPNRTEDTVVEVPKEPDYSTRNNAVGPPSGMPVGFRT